MANFDESAPAKALEGLMPQIEEMCEHLLAEKKRWLASIGWDYSNLPPVYFREPGDWGKSSRITAQTKEDFLRLLAPWKHELGRLMLKHPREERETFTDYLQRLRDVGAGDNWYSRFENMKLFLAHIARIEDEERAVREREEQARERARRDEQSRKRAERKALERQATVDEREVKRLQAIIEEAREVEELMAIIERAKDARHALLGMYTKERDACVALGKPVPERSIPGWPDALGPPIRISNPIAMNGEGRRADTASPPQELTHG